MSDRGIKILVAVPNTGHLVTATAVSIAEMLQHFEASSAPFPKEARLIAAQGSILPEIRHKLVAEAYEYGATHMLWVDSDMRFPKDALNRLLNHGKHVVGVNYARKESEARSTASTLDERPLSAGSTGLIEVAHMGFGLMLVSMSAYDAIDLPFFAFEPIPPTNARCYGEDVTFGRKLRKAGVKMFCDADLSRHVQHIGPYSYTLAADEAVEPDKPKLQLVT